MSILVAPLGGKAKVILSPDFTLYRISAIAAIKQVYLSTGSAKLLSLEQYSKCLRK